MKITIISKGSECVPTKDVQPSKYQDTYLLLHLYHTLCLIIAFGKEKDSWR